MCQTQYVLIILLSPNHNETAEVPALSDQMNDAMNEHDVEQSRGSWCLRCLAKSGRRVPSRI